MNKRLKKKINKTCKKKYVKIQCSQDLELLTTVTCESSMISPAEATWGSFSKLSAKIFAVIPGFWWDWSTIFTAQKQSAKVYKWPQSRQNLNKTNCGSKLKKSQDRDREWWKRVIYMSLYSKINLIHQVAWCAMYRLVRLSIRRKFRVYNMYSSHSIWKVKSSHISWSPTNGASQNFTM